MIYRPFSGAIDFRMVVEMPFDYLPTYASMYVSSFSSQSVLAHSVGINCWV